MAYSWAAAKGLLKGDHAFFGISHDDPDVTPPEHCRYDVCVALSGTASNIDPGEEKTAEISGGRYAVFPFEGTSDDLGPLFSKIYGSWLPQSGEASRDAPCFERYTQQHTMDEKTGRFTCDVLIPIA